jgi:hypothetical protein
MRHLLVSVIGSLSMLVACADVMPPSSNAPPGTDGETDRVLLDSTASPPALTSSIGTRRQVQLPTSVSLGASCVTRDDTWVEPSICEIARGHSLMATGRIASMKFLYNDPTRWIEEGDADDRSWCDHRVLPSPLIVEVTDVRALWGQAGATTIELVIPGSISGSWLNGPIKRDDVPVPTWFNEVGETVERGDGIGFYPGDEIGFFAISLEDTNQHFMLRSPMFGSGYDSIRDTDNITFVDQSTFSDECPGYQELERTWQLDELRAALNQCVRSGDEFDAAAGRFEAKARERHDGTPFPQLWPSCYNEADMVDERPEEVIPEGMIPVEDIPREFRDER